MKRLILLIALFVTCHDSFAQGVGINTTLPDPSAALDINSDNKGVLVPRVSLSSVNDNTTILNPALGLLIWNTNTNLPSGSGFYYNDNATPGTAKWINLSSQFKLPHYDVGSSSSPLLQLENYKSASSAVAIQGDYAGNNAGGTGVVAKSALGIALKVDGRMNISGPSQIPTQGKVLTSDASGNATWEGAVAFRASGVVGGGSEKIAKNVETKVPFYQEDYDLSNNYTNANGSPHSTFTAPVAGMYHFDINLHWKYPFGETELQTVSIALIRTRNNITSTLSRSTSVTNSSVNGNDVSDDVQLMAGDQISVSVYHDKFDYLDLFTNTDSNKFSGRLVMKL